ncbi:anti-sigma factor domain-containing protein [Cryobacterium sp. M25]|uniref:anti-sigma factor domain-containing protein n=1 Tax=Cryobacterium sp. M25 TaxID=2048293 RepID=UPI000CE44F9B|nr:anti-sigma factor [Cryobacterium sp. M25]
MTHIDRENLALIAMTEFDLTEPERQHLSECPGCSLELIALQHTANVGRSARSVQLVEPGDRVWAGIHAALGLSDAVAATPGRSGYEAADQPIAADQPTAVVEPVETPAPVVEPVETPSATVTDIGSALRPRPRRRNWMPMAVAAGIAGLLGGLGGGIWWQSAQQQEPAPVLLAEAQLDPYPGWDAAGSAYVAKTADGHREVVLDVTGVSADTDLREVWLIKADASGLISIGLLDGESGRFAIPDGVDLSQYPLVDVSAEPDDGDPQHSGDSILRGELRTA